jgi:hypothetical protein
LEGVRVPFPFFFESLQFLCRSGWSRRQGVRRYQNGGYRGTLGGFFGRVPDLGLFFSVAEVAGF